MFHLRFMHFYFFKRLTVTFSKYTLVIIGYLGSLLKK